MSYDHTSYGPTRTWARALSRINNIGPAIVELSKLRYRKKKQEKQEKVQKSEKTNLLLKKKKRAIGDDIMYPVR